MSIVIDIVLVAIVICIIVYSAKKGVIITALEIVAFVAAIFLAGQCAQPVASAMYTGLFEKTVQNKLYDVIPEDPSGLTYAQKAEKAVEGIPDFAKNYATSVGIDVNTISEKIASSNFANNDELYLTIEKNIVKPISVAVLKNIMFFILSIAFGLILRYVAKAIGKSIKNVDALGSLDKMLGGVFGILKGLVIVFLLCCLLTYLQPKLTNPDIRNAISDSAIVSAADKFDPMDAVTASGVFNNTNS